MSVVAEFTIPAEALPFGETLVNEENMKIEVERIIPTQESAFPFFWVWGTHPEAFMQQAEEEPDIANVQLLETVEGGALFRAEWSPDAEIIKGIEQLDGTLIKSVGMPAHWRFEVRAETHETFRNFQKLFDEKGISIELQRLYDLSDLVDSSPHFLTPEQRKTLIAAFRQGYFESPRKTSQEELGEQFGISHRAVSDRLRRGIRNLISEEVLPSGEQS